MRSIIIFLVLFATATATHAGEKTWLGKARLWNNDEIGDRKDRWRTGSYSLSYIRGSEWNGRLPSGVGELVEYRVRGEVIAPESLYVATPATDRRLVGVFQVGAFTHLAVKGLDVSFGVDMVFTGAQTGMVNFQSLIHQALGYTVTPIAGSQLGNAVYPTLNGEVSRRYQLSDDGERQVVFRPFIEGQVGVETYVRVGGDFTFGLSGPGDFKVRDVTTGQRNIAVKGSQKRGISYLLGGDVAYVQSSQYLPAALGPVVEAMRVRLRGGIYVEEGQKSLFYGVTWLGKEYEGQSSGQILGSVSLRFKF
ncbi:MAG: hypothetical protein ACI8YI_000165 [Paracoccaceae bacterium]|jgi:hypothetical protein